MSPAMLGRFTVEGLSVLDLGVAKVSAQGKVTNLKKLKDFNGTDVLGVAFKLKK